MRNFLVMVRATSRTIRVRGNWMYARLVLLLNHYVSLIPIGPRLRGDHHVNKAVMVSLDGRGPSAGH